MFSRLKRGLTTYFSPDVAKEIQPESYAETGGSNKALFNPTKNNRQTIEKYLTIYEQGGMISEAIDLYSLFMFSKGYRWEGDPNAIGACKEFLDGFDFEQSFHLAVISPLVCGDGYQEILKNRAGDLKGLLYRNPAYWSLRYDATGLVTGYSQTMGNSLIRNKSKDFELDQIFHTQMIPSLKEGPGISLIARAIDEIHRDTRMADGTATAIERHGHPKWWARCGREGQAVSPSVLNAITQKLEDLNSKNDIATQYDVAIQALDTGGVGNVQAYQDASLVRLTAAMGVPGELLGFRQGTTDNTAVSRVGAFLQKCDSYNYRFARTLNLQLFDQITGKAGAAKIVFNSVIPSKQAENAAWIVSLIKANPLDPEAYAPREWVKQVLNIPDTIEEIAA